MPNQHTTSYAERIISASKPRRRTKRLNPATVQFGCPAHLDKEHPYKRKSFARLKGTYSEETGYVPARKGMAKGYKRSGVSGMKKTLALIAASKELQDIRNAIEEGRTMEEFDPQAFEAVGVILQIMRGKLRGRHITVRLAAARSVLEQFRGLPKRQLEVEVGTTYADLIERSIDANPTPTKQLTTPVRVAIADAIEAEEFSDDHPPTGDHDELGLPDDGLDLADYA